MSKILHVGMNLTAPALERLLGGDSELEVLLRRQVAEKFVENHFRNLLKEDEIKSLFESARKDAFSLVNKSIKKEIGHIDKWGRINSLTPGLENTLLESIREKVDIEAASNIRSVIEEQMASFNEEIDKKISIAIDKEVALRVSKGIQEKLNSLID